MMLVTTIGSVTYSNPIMVASGTFGYAREMQGLFDPGRLGAIVPKTVTLAPRAGNRPPRTVETSAGLLNSIGLDNDGLDEFLAVKMAFLRTLGTPIIMSVAAKNLEECPVVTAKINEYVDRFPAGEKGLENRALAAIELNVSCPNVSGGVDFATDPVLCERIVAAMKKDLPLPLYVKLSPNVTNIAAVALAAEQGGADALCAINTCLGLAVDWRRRRPRLGNGFGGLSGPAVKPIALRCVHQIYKAVRVPVIGIGGIATIDDVLEFIVAGARAVQIGTANFHDPSLTVRLIEALPGALAEAGVETVAELVGALAF